MGVLEEGGPALLEEYPLKGLSWEQVKKLKGPNLVGLGMGPGPAPGVCLTLVFCSESAHLCCYESLRRPLTRYSDHRWHVPPKCV